MNKYLIIDSYCPALNILLMPSELTHCEITYVKLLSFQSGEADDRDQSKLEVKMWDPECPLTNKQIDQFLVVARYVF